jgi:hypothetical protein
MKNTLILLIKINIVQMKQSTKLWLSAPMVVEGRKSVKYQTWIDKNC